MLGIWKHLAPSCSRDCTRYKQNTNAHGGSLQEDLGIAPGPPHPKQGGNLQLRLSIFPAGDLFH